MKRKTKWLAIGFSSLALSAVLPFAACSAGLKTINEDVGEYTYYYQQVFVDKHAENITIDGKLDEEIYAEQGWMYHGDSGLTFQYTTAFDNYGVYIGAIAYDPAIIYRARFDLDEYVGHNSGFAFYVTTSDNNNSIQHPMKRLKLETDAKGRRSYSQQRFEAYTVVDGELNGATTSMTTEVFFSWKALGITEKESLDDSEIPEAIKMEPVYRHVTLQAGDMYVLETLYPTFTEPSMQNEYSLFGANGYLNADPDDKAKLKGTRLGDAMAGHWMAKTDGWDMTHYLDTDGSGSDVGYVKSVITGDFADALYFKDVYAENFYAQVYCDVTNAGGQVGLIAQDSFSEFRAVYLDCANASATKSKFSIRALTYYPNRVWKQTYGVEDTDKNYVVGEPIRFEMVKNGNTISFLVNGKLVYSDTQSWYSGSFAPGLFALNAEATFFEYYAEALTDEEAEKKLSELGVSYVELDYDLRSGAKITTQDMLAFTDNFNFDIELPVGYAVSLFTINGRDVLADYRKNVQNGVYVPTVDFEDGRNPLVNQNGVTRVQIEVDSISYMFGNNDNNYGNKIYVAYVKDPDGKKLSGAAVTIREKNNPAIYYVTNTGTDGRFTFNDLPVAGYKLGDDTVGGTYVITVTLGGYETLQYEIIVGGDFGEGKTGMLTETKELTPILIGGKTTVGNRTYTSSNDWAIENQNDGKAIATLTGSKGDNLAVFGDVVSDCAVIDFTVYNTTPNEEDYDQYPGFGVALLNEDLGNGFGLIVVGGQVRTLSGLVWSNTTSVAYDVNYSDLFATQNLRNTDVKLRFVHADDTLKVYVYDTSASIWRFLHAQTNTNFDQLCGYGLFKTGSLINATLKDVSITYGADAATLVRAMDNTLGGETVIDGSKYNSFYASEKEWTFTAQADGKFSAELDTSTGHDRVMFGGVASDCAVIDFTVYNSTPNEGPYDQYPGFGVALMNGDLGGGFGLIVVGGQVRTLSNLVWSDTTSFAYDVDFSYLFATHELRDTDVKLRFVHVDDTLKVYVYDSSEKTWRWVYTQTDTRFDQLCGYGLFKTGGSIDATLKDVSITYGADAKAIIDTEMSVS